MLMLLVMGGWNDGMFVAWAEPSVEECSSRKLFCQKSNLTSGTAWPAPFVDATYVREALQR